MSYACVTEPFRAANLLSERRLYDVVTFGPKPAATSSGGVSVASHYAIGDAIDLDLLLVIAGGDPFECRDRRMFSWIRRLAGLGFRIGGVSGGPVILAAAGLMKGRRMTVHWEHAPRLADLFPDLVIERRLFVIDRDRVTCGGGIAPLDMIHALISEQHGAGFAREVSDWFLHTDIRAASAPQTHGGNASSNTRSPRVDEAISAMESHIGDPLSLRQIALLVDVTPRHLNRLFRHSFHEGAMAHYRRLRLAIARRMLKGSHMDIAEIAAATGFAGAAHFSNAYLKVFGIRPSRDRSPM
jgi:transcriptional regulator GlxA family with amidase domain